ncbi:hypothetical protein ATL42_2725 [Sanguibacter antarcticus]|uniref:Uncharacterized protein n=1 Tax=Sanguibacter antarcticus TaxID=372484 RepID=A0A2A9E995_9MICO|nr:hypothetical protein ATL42_2725 [Sanguibacter antarcticus]
MRGPTRRNLKGVENPLRPVARSLRTLINHQTDVPHTPPTPGLEVSVVRHRHAGPVRASYGVGMVRIHVSRYPVGTCSKIWARARG